MPDGPRDDGEAARAPARTVATRGMGADGVRAYRMGLFGSLAPLDRSLGATAPGRSSGPLAASNKKSPRFPGARNASEDPARLLLRKVYARAAV